MSRRLQNPPSLEQFLSQVPESRSKPAAFVLAGHNGSGKSTLWNDRLSTELRIPLINADRLTESILPARDSQMNHLPIWAQKLRDEDERWQKLSQQGVQAFSSLAIENKIPFAFETVFSHWKPRFDGTVESKIDLIQRMQKKGYFVVLLFVGLLSVELSILRVSTRKTKGGHDVPLQKLIERFPRTQKAIGAASPVADMTLMFDNSREEGQAFTLVRAQTRQTIHFDCRDPGFRIDRTLRLAATPWLDQVVGPRVFDDGGNMSTRKVRLKK